MAIVGGPIVVRVSVPIVVVSIFVPVVSDIALVTVPCIVVAERSSCISQPGTVCTQSALSQTKSRFSELDKYHITILSM